MVYKEEELDLFTVPEEYFLAHCVSADFAMGRGIAMEFNRRFDMRTKLKENFPDYSYLVRRNGFHGDCILMGRVLNLITKDKFYQKPTYETMLQALQSMKRVCSVNHIRKVAMPIIGCGLDRLQWELVSSLVQNVFRDTDVEILVCRI